MGIAITRRFDRDAATRMIAAGTAWGLTLAGGLLAMGAWQCGLPCSDDVAITTVLSVAAGIVTIGPIAAFHSRR